MLVNSKLLGRVQIYDEWCRHKASVDFNNYLCELCKANVFNEKVTTLLRGENQLFYPGFVYQLTMNKHYLDCDCSKNRFLITYVNYYKKLVTEVVMDLKMICTPRETIDVFVNTMMNHLKDLQEEDRASLQSTHNWCKM